MEAVSIQETFVNDDSFVTLASTDAFQRLSLFEWLDSGNQDVRFERILDVTRQVLSKLNMLHAQCKLHGCLTPNVISVAPITSEVHLQIVSKNADDCLTNTDAIQDACYLAPEQTGVLPRAATPATDLYAVGLLLYRMITGSNPLTATSLNDLLMRQMTWVPSSLRQNGFRIPRSLDELILRLVKRDASDRYQKTNAVLYDIELILDLVRSNRLDDTIVIGTTDTRERIAEPSLVGRTIWISNFVRRISSDLRISHSPWIIQGSSGEGKSRLLHEFASVAASRSLMVLRAAGTQSELSRPLEAIATVLRDLESACKQNVALREHLQRELNSHSESLQPLMPWLWDERVAPSSETGPESFAGRRLKQALQSLFWTLSQLEQRTVLLIDDLDRCDEISRGLFLDWIQTQQQKLSGRLILIASMSTEAAELSPRASGVLNESLGHLSTTETAQLLHSMAGDFPEEAISLIASAAHGNPYMAISLLYGMLESGTAVACSNGWKIRSLSMESLQGHRIAGRDIVTRMQSLTTECRRFLTAAAILGRNCSFQEARCLARLSGQDAQDGFEMAIQRQLVLSDATRQNLGFVHDAIRQGFLDELSTRDRVALHLRGARMIMQGSSDRFFELAYHFDAAGRAKQATEFAMLAAKQSQLQYATELAIRYYQIALRWIPSEEKQRIGQVTEELAEVYLSIGEYDSAETAYVQALQTATDQLAKMRITGKLGDVEFKRGHMQKASEHYTQALALSGVSLPHTSASMIVGLLRQVGRQTIHTTFGLSMHRPPAAPHHRLRWNLLSRLAHTYWFSRGALWTLLAHLRGLNEAERYQDSPELAKAYSEHAPVCSLLGLFGRAEEYSRRSLRIRVKMNDLWGQGQTLSYSGVVQLAAARFTECVKVSMEAVELLQKTGDAWETNMARYQGANALYRLGRFREAAEHAQQIHLSGVEIGDAQAAGISLDILMRAAPSMVSPSVIEGQATISRTDAQSHAQTQLALAVLRLRQGRYQDAVVILVDAIACCKKAGHLNTYISPCYVWLATARRMMFLSTSRQNVALLRQRHRIAHQAAHQAFRVAKKYRADLAHAYRELALLDVMNGRLARARRYFDLSLAVARELESPMEEYESLRCLVDIAQDLDDLQFPISKENRERFITLQTSMADSIALIEIVKHEQASLSLVDRFDKLLEDGRRIAGSLSKESIFTEGCLAAQHLLRGQSVFLFERSNTDDRWTIAHHLSSQANVCQVPKSQDYQRYILETCEIGLAKIFSTESYNGLTHGSLIAVPIRSRETIVACLAVEHTEIDKLFGQAELQVAEFIATLTGAALENAEGFASLRDLNTTLEQRVAARTEELREAMAIAVAASQAKSQFLATMSHEVRTPLNGILGMTRLALAKSLDSQQSNYLSTIQRSGESLLNLLNDLLDFSKIEAGKMMVESIPFDPRQMLGDVIGLMSAPAWQKGIEVIVNFDPRLPEKLLGDGVRLRQIVANLVGNAIKFTASGHIEIRVDVLDDEDKNAIRWKITVIDSGIGIPKSKQALIFEAFSQADGTTTRRFGGTGLGLSISVELVKLMQGTIEVESEEHVGSQFSVVLPLRACPQPITTQLHSCRLPEYNVLLLEPNAVARRSLERLLESWGATVVAIDQWSQLDDRDAVDFQLFHLAIVSGPEAPAISEITKRSGLVTWLVHSPDTIPVAGLPSLCKPVLPCDLVRHFVELAPISRQFESNTMNSDSLIATSQSTSSSGGLRVLVAEDGEINRMVLVGLLELIGHTATVVENGLQATQLVAKESFDICLMDLDMPEMDGVQATRVIRSSGNPLAIYAMTAHHDEHHANLCREAGMNGYLTKPIQADQLKQILQSVASSIPE